MSLETLYNYVSGILERNVVQVDEHDEKKLLSEMPSTEVLSTVFATNQLRSVYHTLQSVRLLPQQAQELELFIVACRLDAIKKEEAAIANLPTCNKCGRGTEEIVAIAVGTELYSCCKGCADKVCDYIGEE